MTTWRPPEGSAGAGAAGSTASGEIAPGEGRPYLSVILPAHNELMLLGSTVTNLVSGLDARGLDYEILVVENGSRDGTLRLARILAAQIPGLRILTLPVGDYGAALRAGFLAARGSVVVNFDVDYYDFGFLDTALELVRSGHAAIVVASKRAPGARDRRPLLRRLLTALFAATLTTGLGLQVTDAHGMKVLRREALEQVVERCVMRGSLFDVEMVLRAGHADLAVREVPAVVVEVRPPRTPVWRRSIESLAGVVRLRRELERERRAT